MILEELNYINQLLESCLNKMEELLRPKPGNILWRLFFPAGQFIQQKSIAREASLLLLKINTRFKDMEEVLEERQHPLEPEISEIMNIDLVAMSKNLIELPERAQYMISQIDNLKKTVEVNINDLSSQIS